MRIESVADFDRPLFAGRQTLMAGCIAVLGIMCFSTVDISRSLERTSAKSDQMMTSFRERTQILEELCSALIRRGAMSCTHLAGPDEKQSSNGRAEVLVSRQQTEQLLDKFEIVAQTDSDSNTINWIANFIWGIADDLLRDVYVRGKYRDVILPMTVIRRLDAILEPTKQAVLRMTTPTTMGRASVSGVRDQISGMESRYERPQLHSQRGLHHADPLAGHRRNCGSVRWNVPLNFENQLTSVSCPAPVGLRVSWTIPSAEESRKSRPPPDVFLGLAADQEYRCTLLIP
jgi:HsdM N-terminal domain